MDRDESKKITKIFSLSDWKPFNTFQSFKSDIS